MLYRMAFVALASIALVGCVEQNNLPDRVAHVEAQVRELRSDMGEVKNDVRALEGSVGELLTFKTVASVLFGVLLGAGCLVVAIWSSWYRRLLQLQADTLTGLNYLYYQHRKAVSAQAQEVSYPPPAQLPAINVNRVSRVHTTVN